MSTGQDLEQPHRRRLPDDVDLEAAMDSVESTHAGPQVDDDDSVHTVVEVPTRGRFQPEKLDLARVTSLGCPTEQSLYSPTSTCFGSGSSAKDLEKGLEAPYMIQHQLGAYELETSDVAPVVSRGHGSHPSYNPKEMVSVLPTKISPLPYKRERRIWRRIRHRLLSVYQRLFSVVLIGNLIAVIILLVNKRHSHPFGPSLENLATATAANITGAILIRQEYVINALYTFFCWTPLCTPLRIRRMVAKFYHFGGVHSGCAISSLIWFILYTVLMTKQFTDGDFNELPIIVITYVLLALLLSICLFAIPRFRIVSHNSFEAIHRFGGWLAVALFWVDTILVSAAEARNRGADSMGMIVIKAPTFWFLVVITFFIILPWIRLRKVEAIPEILSDHAIRIHFNYTKVGAVLGIRITHQPLKDWHSFASIPEADGSSFSIIVSDAGDWTKKQIQNPSNSYWVRGIPITGVLRMAAVFKRVVVVTTGSGIGPCLSMLVSHPMPCRILWSTPNPTATYGDTIVQAVTNADPDAMIINTKTTGRPDMVALTHHLFKESNAEAVFIISNPSLTRKVVYGMESRGIPAYGPIWDS